MSKIQYIILLFSSTYFVFLAVASLAFPDFYHKRRQLLSLVVLPIALLMPYSFQSFGQPVFVVLCAVVLWVSYTLDLATPTGRQILPVNFQRFFRRLHAVHLFLIESFSMVLFVLVPIGIVLVVAWFARRYGGL